TGQFDQFFFAEFFKSGRLVIWLCHFRFRHDVVILLLLPWWRCRTYLKSGLSPHGSVTKQFKMLTYYVYVPLFELDSIKIIFPAVYMTINVILKKYSSQLRLSGNIRL
ncbi:MAG TPA: hypothetical protein VLM43_12545, partial [Desulfobacterales bacterium]|nr:hypothetical protein [Desulfobacterales bacterium]